MVSGHATNVSALGHLLGPQDAIVHDALAHDSLIAGARQSGARRRSFPHNDMAALDRILGETRPQARRLLVAVEGIYSMDGDFAPLDQVTRIARRHQALLFVDEAHSLGTAGATGRGAAEHFGIGRRDVDIWMGTLSKSLASCGGYIAGSRALIEYLRYTMPGFIYSVGISPANAAAALAAAKKLAAEPDRVARLQRNAALFLDLCRERGIDTGLCQRTPVVPCIVGDSMDAVCLSQALFERGINVQPIIHPAVEENQARLRFFVTALHTAQQLLRTANVLCEELARLRLAKPPAAEKRLDRSRAAAN
jgi:7-keto-8-aminopelargonate synthetase-like enzyme